MWQRIQTVFLAIVIISLIASVFLPIWVYQDPLGQSHELYPLHYTVKEKAESNTQYFPYALTAMLAIAAATLAIIEIRKFKKRVVQMKLGALNSLFIAGTIASAVVYSNQLVKTFEGGHYGLGLWLPGVAVICNLLANRFIRRDERLVRDSQRLR
jgi:glucan phosphoethanolaminetransferase (alkaline phosphatase superfamily)